MSHSMKVLTRAEMEAEYGAAPFGQCKTWTIHRAHASVTYVTDDGGEHWTRRNLIHAAQRAQRDEQAMEMAAIQRDLK